MAQGARLKEPVSSRFAGNGSAVPQRCRSEALCRAVEDILVERPWRRPKISTKMSFSLYQFSAKRHPPLFGVDQMSTELAKHLRSFEPEIVATQKQLAKVEKKRLSFQEKTAEVSLRCSSKLLIELQEEYDTLCLRRELQSKISDGRDELQKALKSQGAEPDALQELLAEFDGRALGAEPARHLEGEGCCDDLYESHSGDLAEDQLAS